MGDLEAFEVIVSFVPSEERLFLDVLLQKGSYINFIIYTTTMRKKKSMVVYLYKKSKGK